jgi:hypothetical protein
MEKSRSLFAIAMTIFLFSCFNTSNNPTSAGSKPLFTALVAEPGSDSIAVIGMVRSSPQASTLSANIDGLKPDSVVNSFFGNWADYTMYGILGGAVYWGKNLNGQETVNLISDVGKCSGVITIPSPVKITSFASIDSIDASTSLVLQWNGDADWYDISYNISTIADSFPSGGGTGYHFNNSPFDTFATSNSITLPPSNFPANWYDINISITAINGPFPRGGSLANMTGDGPGFLYAVGSGNDSLAQTTIHRKGSAAKIAQITNVYKTDSIQVTAEQLLKRITSTLQMGN